MNRIMAKEKVVNNGEVETVDVIRFCHHLTVKRKCPTDKKQGCV